MERIKVIESRVKELLEQLPETRENDQKLYKTYIETYHFVEFNADTFVNYKDYGLPSFKSIERCRRKLQNEYGICEAGIEVTKERKEAEYHYTNYSIENHIPRID